MKKTISVIVLSILLTSCFNSKEGSVNVDISTFKGSVKFTNLCDEKLTEKYKITRYIKSMCTKVKYNCSNSATFIPLECRFASSKLLGDTILIDLKGTAENNYGVPGEITGCGYIIKGVLLNDINVYDF